MNIIVAIWEVAIEFFLNYALSIVNCFLGNLLPGLPC